MADVPGVAAPVRKTPFIAKFSMAFLTNLMRVCNIINGCLLVLSCIFAFSLINGSPTRTFLAIYIGFFAILLLLFEIRIRKSSEGFVKKYFGFMYDYAGRTAFLLFCGAINFGMLDGQSSENSSKSYLVVMGVGIITCANAFFNCFVLCTHPDFKVKPPPPKAALTQDEVLEYIRAHPELVNKASDEIHGAKPGPLKPAPKPVKAGTAAPSAAAAAPAPAVSTHMQHTGADDNPFDSPLAQPKVEHYQPPARTAAPVARPAPAPAPVAHAHAPAPAPVPVAAPAPAPAAHAPPPVPARQAHTAPTHAPAPAAEPDNPFD